MPTMWTIGHSTRTSDELIRVLQSESIAYVADVRRFPGSKTHPQFTQEALRHALGEASIAYQHFPELGGRRRPIKDSANTVWRNSSFRGYADYMESDEFRGGIARLLSIIERCRATVMCAELLWWRCHRALIADYVQINHGIRVVHILGLGEIREHPLTAPARVVDGRLTYQPALSNSGSNSGSSSGAAGAH